MCSRIHGPPTSRATRSRVLLGGELQDQDQVPLIDFGNAGGKPARRHDALDDLLQLLDG